jgi:hypothetical protein
VWTISPSTPARLPYVPLTANRVTGIVSARRSIMAMVPGASRRASSTALPWIWDQRNTT